jgi:hypothetical protein
LKHAAVAAAALLLTAGCQSLPWSRERATPPVSPTSPAIVPKRGEVVIAAWAEPRSLPRRGGQAQILVRVQRVGGGSYPGVQVRLRTSEGRLFSDGQALMTDAAGMIRDRLTAAKPAQITVQVGDMRYRFKVDVRP